MRVALELHQPVAPIIRSERDWLGTRCPVSSASAVRDLGGWTRITRSKARLSSDSTAAIVAMDGSQPEGWPPPAAGRHCSSGRRMPTVQRFMVGPSGGCGDGQKFIRLPYWKTHSGTSLFAWRAPRTTRSSCSRSPSLQEHTMSISLTRPSRSSCPTPSATAKARSNGSLTTSRAPLPRSAKVSGYCIGVSCSGLIVIGAFWLTATRNAGSQNPMPRGDFGQEKGPGEYPTPCDWWRRGGSNSRPSHCERDALPAELRPHVAPHDNTEMQRATLRCGPQVWHK